MSTTRNFLLRMTADGANLEASLNKQADLMDNLKMSATGLSGAFEKVGIGLPSIFAGLSFGGMMAGAKHYLDQILEFKHASVSLGISLKDVAGIKFAAGSHWEGVQVGLGKLLKVLGEATLGTKDAARGFELLDLKAKELSGLKTEAILGIIADRMKAIENPAERAYVASLLFGKAWSEMIPILEKGSVGIQHAIDKTNEFGEVTEESAASAKRLKKRYDELGESVSGYFRKFVGETAENFDAVSAAYDRLDKRMYKWIHGRPPPSENAAPVPEELIKTPQEKMAEEAAGKLTDSISELTSKLKLERDALVMGKSEVEEFARKHKEATPKMLEAARAIEAETKHLKEKQDNEKRWGDRAKKIADDSRSAYEKYGDELREIDVLQKKNMLTADQAAAAIGRVGEKLLSLEKAENTFKAAEGLERGSSGAFAAMDRYRREAEGGGNRDTAKTIDEGLKRGLDEAKKHTEYLKTIAKSDRLRVVGF